VARGIKGILQTLNREEKSVPLWNEIVYNNIPLDPKGIKCPPAIIGCYKEMQIECMA